MYAGVDLCFSAYIKHETVISKILKRLCFFNNDNQVFIRMFSLHITEQNCTDWYSQPFFICVIRDPKLMTHRIFWR